eukprot:CAMPEP_0196820646 /NCGR_PEP_ID=MMETSP1362-20130617/76185_1 /TAXON_ID=163516 /ORGANISM="Leptocylindrus danicus, Strain CCMP1856" /LENGTH=107 /DNA_ID=CAMNT_0042199609 /DNA_START=89 /DNA_END=409 /DNA_ORIENTATION=-
MASKDGMLDLRWNITDALRVSFQKQEKNVWSTLSNGSLTSFLFQPPAPTIVYDKHLPTSKPKHPGMAYEPSTEQIIRQIADLIKRAAPSPTPTQLPSSATSTQQQHA